MWPVLHELFGFPQVPVSDTYMIGVSVVGDVPNTRTQFRHLDPLNFMIFEENKTHIILVKQHISHFTWMGDRNFIFSYFCLVSSIFLDN